MSELTVCPRCGQGDVLQMVVATTGEQIQVCDECDATWPAGVEPHVPGFKDLSQYLRSLGLPPLWSSLKKLNDESAADRRMARQFLIKDLQMKKPRAALEADVKAAGGNPSLWPKVGPSDHIRTIERPHEAPAVGFTKAAALSNESVYVIFGMRDNAGVGKCKVEAMSET